MRKLIHNSVYFIFIIISIFIPVLDLFNILPGDISLLSKILNWILIGILVYHLSFIKVLFGKKQYKKIKDLKIKYYILDIAVLLSFYMFNISDIISFVLNHKKEFFYFSRFAGIISGNYIFIEMFFFNIAAIFLICVSLVLGFRVKFGKDSLMSLLHEDILPGGFDKRLFRSLSVLFVLSGIYITYFSLVLEWFSLVLDLPFTLAGIFLIIYTFKNKHKIKENQIVEKLTFFSEFFEENLLVFFHKKEKIMFTFSGLLVLHLFTDIFNFLLPFLTGTRYNLYSAILQKNFWVGDFIIKDLSLTNILSIFWIYFLILFFFICLLLFPIYLWYISLNKEKLKISRWAVSLFFSSLVVILIKSNIYFDSLGTKLGLTGVYFYFSNKASFLLGHNYLSILTLTIFVMIFTMIRYHTLKKIIEIIVIIAILIVFSEYTLKFFKSILFFYFESINTLINNNMFFILVFIIIFFLCSVIFYLGSYFVFISQTISTIKRSYF
ncbi:hypothetical protein GF327_03660 [Candidatus Woesearchaeota archaeon]|nr:hypothetical protein [Candidatus Woesearchaeota archaeon]